MLFQTLGLILVLYVAETKRKREEETHFRNVRRRLLKEVAQVVEERWEQLFPPTRRDAMYHVKRFTRPAPYLSWDNSMYLARTRFTREVRRIWRQKQ
jgi:hypothetical protein